MNHRELQGGRVNSRGVWHAHIPSKHFFILLYTLEALRPSYIIVGRVFYKYSLVASCTQTAAATCLAPRPPPSLPSSPIL